MRRTTKALPPPACCWPKIPTIARTAREWQFTLPTRLLSTVEGAVDSLATPSGTATAPNATRRFAMVHILSHPRYCHFLSHPWSLTTITNNKIISRPLRVLFHFEKSFLKWHCRFELNLPPPYNRRTAAAVLFPFGSSRRRRAVSSLTRKSFTKTSSSDRPHSASTALRLVNLPPIAPITIPTRAQRTTVMPGSFSPSKSH